MGENRDLTERPGADSVMRSLMLQQKVANAVQVGAAPPTLIGCKCILCDVAVYGQDPGCQWALCASCKQRGPTAARMQLALERQEREAYHASRPYLWEQFLSLRSEHMTLFQAADRTPKPNARASIGQSS